MSDLTKLAEADSTQVNSVDLQEPRIIEVTKVDVKAGDQPVSIYFKGDDRAFRPCKSMIRVLIKGWGKESDKYIGRKMEIYNDPSVRWAGQEQGGIRISAMSHIKDDFSMMLTIARTKKALYSVKKIETEPKNDLLDNELETLSKALDDAKTMADLATIVATAKERNFADSDNKNALGEKFKAAQARIRNL